MLWKRNLDRNTNVTCAVYISMCVDMYTHTHTHTLFTGVWV